MRNFQLFPGLRRATTRRRLWLGGVAIGLFLLTLVVGNGFIAREKSVTREMLGHDFLAFYTAGSFVRDGRARELYNLESVKAFQQSTSAAAGLEVGSSFGPWWNPPFYAMVFEPLAALPYMTALKVWRWIGIAAVLVAICILASFVASGGRACFLLVPLLIVVSFPFIQAMSHGQNTFTSLLLLVVTVALWRGGRAWGAGMVAGLLFYKPQLAAVVAVAMVVDLGWRALGGLCVTGAALLLVTIVKMPGSIGDYLRLLPVNVRWMQVENLYLWERHVTLKAFWRLLLQGREAGEMWAVTSALVWGSILALLSMMAWIGVRDWRWRRALPEADDAVRRDRWIAATVAVMPLVMPFYFDYDLLLLSVPATLYAVECVRRPEGVRGSDVWLTRGWVALFLWLFVNPGLAMRTHVNVTVLLLSCVAGMLVARAGRGADIAVARTDEMPEAPLLLAA